MIIEDAHSDINNILIIINTASYLYPSNSEQSKNTNSEILTILYYNDKTITY